ncbi:alpha-galactosidase [Catalinimonas alkaloidigena]|nr:alpha-galactosidase [Catalinimonas alkaloidigena]
MRFLLPFLLALCTGTLLAAPADSLITVETEHTALVMRVTPHGDVSVVYLGNRLQQPADYQTLPVQPAQGQGYDYTELYNSAYTPAGSRNLLEPALRATHADGNPSLDLRYVSHQTQRLDQGIRQTAITLKDPQYPFEVVLYYKTYPEVDVIEQWSTIRHRERKDVVLHKYASANLYLPAQSYYLTHFHGDWAREMNPREEQLSEGIKVLDSKLGARADLFQPPSFLLAFNQPAHEDHGDVLLANLAWSGNYKIDFEVDPLHNLRLIAGINPYASEYYLPANQTFTTPALVYTFSSKGTGQASRNLHRWARRYRIPQGQEERLTLLNNWEATYFDFNEPKLTALFKDGADLGVDLFLLDDGWFANKYPRNDDHTGLGDWQENRQKLPHGIGYLVKEAQAAGVKFGIWLEPEMVSPKSELYEKHPDWVIKLPNRDEYYFRNQLVLDLSNPKVQDFVYGVVDDLMTKNPDLSYIKWDCNAVIYNAYSATAKHQTHLYVDYVNGLYDVLERLRQKYPTLPLMLCSGGGGRVDYGALRYFTEFWPSDNTDGLERVFIQWNYSYFYPALATCNHITEWGDQSLKYRTDVAMMGKLGYDIVVGELPEKELRFSQQALQQYEKMQDVIWQGDQYRLASPYEGDVASLLYVNEAQNRAVWFSYLVSERFQAGSHLPVRLKGLDPAKKYRIRELNLYPDARTPFGEESVYSGDYLMQVGVNPQVNGRRSSVVLEVNAVE